MEGKAVLYDAFVGISATPVLDRHPRRRRSSSTTVLRVAPTFGGIHLEDIRIPTVTPSRRSCIERLEKPVMHDDQHGTATVALAAVINACQITGIDLNARPRRADRPRRSGQRHRPADAGLRRARRARPRPLAGGHGRLEDQGARPRRPTQLMREADIVIAATGRPGLDRPERACGTGQVIFALSNPDAGDSTSPRRARPEPRSRPTGAPSTTRSRTRAFPRRARRAEPRDHPGDDDRRGPHHRRPRRARRRGALTAVEEPAQGGARRRGGRSEGARPGGHGAPHAPPRHHAPAAPVAFAGGLALGSTGTRVPTVRSWHARHPSIGSAT